MPSRDEKGWAAENGVLRYYQALGYEVRNLAPAEAASDLLIVKDGTIWGEVEVKYGRQPGNLERKEKESIERRRLICASQGRAYKLYCTDRVFPPKRAFEYTPTGLEPSKVRNGLSLRVLKHGWVSFPSAGMGQGGNGETLPNPPIPNPGPLEGLGLVATSPAPRAIEEE